MRSRKEQALEAGASRLVVLPMLAMLATTAAAQCPWEWHGAPLQRLGGAAVQTALDFNDGSGPALWAGAVDSGSGGFALKRWDGKLWTAVGQFENHPFLGTPAAVLDLGVHDLGDGPSLYVAGYFEFVDDLLVSSIARWTGTGWEALGAGLRIDGLEPGIAVTARVFDDGSGPALYVGGLFVTAGGQPASNIARWNGSSWQPVGGGMNAEVRSLEIFDDGNGPALYASGYFTQAGGQPAARVARWDGVAWHEVGGGFDNVAHALKSFDDGSGVGARLYAGGRFTQAGSVAASAVAIWNGSVWREVGGGLGGVFQPYALALDVHDDGSGPGLYVGGSFDNAGGIPSPSVARWSGSAWSGAGSGTDGLVTDFARWSDCAGALPDLLVAGTFETAGGVWSPRVALLSGSSWRPVAPTEGPDGTVEASLVWDDGGGEDLYVGGSFTRVGQDQIRHVARWDGQAWSNLGGGIDGDVHALLVWNDGSGEKLYAGGNFDNAGGIPAQGVARWNGAVWEPLGAGIAGIVRVLHVHDDGAGAGPRLHAGGDLYPGEHLLRWDGASWQGTSGVTGGTGWSRGVWSLESFAPSGGTSLLYVGVGSFFQSPGTYNGGIRRWDGNSWTTFVHTNSVVQALESWTDGLGVPRLYVGGSFDTIGPIAASRLARWDGTLWLPLSFGVDGLVRRFAAWDDGGGEALHVGGRYSSAGTQTVNGVSRWNGSDFESLGGGLGSSPYSEVRTITPLPAALGGGLFVGGQIYDVVGEPTSNLAWWEEDCSVGSFCSTSPNSVGPGALISASGSVSICANDFTLVATDAPKNVFGNFYYGPLAAQVPLGNGLRCIGGSVIRLLPAQSTGSSGTLQRLLDFTQPPAGGGPGQVLAGSTWHFQFWYRDPNGGGAGFNLSDGLRATFVP